MAINSIGSNDLTAPGFDDTTSAKDKFKTDSQAIYADNLEMSLFTQQMNAQQTMNNNLNAMRQGQNTQAQTNSEAAIKQSNKGAEMLKAAMGN